MNTSYLFFSKRSTIFRQFSFIFETPWYSDDNLFAVSGSFNKNTFRTILGNSPMSSSLISLFNTSSYTPNNNFQDVRNPSVDSSIQSNVSWFLHLQLNKWLSKWS